MKMKIKIKMNMDIEDYISKQPLVRQNILTRIHMTIIEADKSVQAEVETMMGKEMIVYKGKGLMKYGLSSVKNYMSLHVMPIYGSNTLYSKYKALLNKANFQKGCINFDNEDKMPLEIVKQLIVDSSTLNLVKIKEDYLQQKKIKPEN
jgi:hypothetical protein